MFSFPVIFFINTFQYFAKHQRIHQTAYISATPAKIFSRILFLPACIEVALYGKGFILLVMKEYSFKYMRLLAAEFKDLKKTFEIFHFLVLLFYQSWYNVDQY
jgi:hypothetical protein